MQTIQFPSNIASVVTPNTPKIQVADEPDAVPQPDTQRRILEAFDMSIEFFNRLQDPQATPQGLARLARSGVHGSRIEGINNLDDVRALLTYTTNWRRVQSAKGDDVIVFQGTLPKDLDGHAFAAYATIRQIFSAFGHAGIGSIQIKAGWQREDDFYLCSPVRFPTDVITVQLKTESTGLPIEMLQQWFAGFEVSSLIRVDDGDTIVRCGVVIPLLKHAQKKQNGRSDYRSDHHNHRG